MIPLGTNTHRWVKISLLVIENRESEITDLAKQLALQKSEVEKAKRQIEEMRREQDDLQWGLIF